MKKQLKKFCINAIVIIIVTIIVIIMITMKNFNDYESNATETTVFPSITLTQKINEDILRNVEKEELTYEEDLAIRYASVFEWQSESADFGIEELKHLISECERYDVDVEFMLSLISVESSYISTAKAKTSSATGYCQVIRSTANWIYEDIMKHGEYDEDNHETLATDKNLSISMGVAYVDWLSKRPYTNGDYTKIAMKYYGSTDEIENAKYAEKIRNRMIELFGVREYYEVFYPEGLSEIAEIN